MGDTFLVDENKELLVPRRRYLRESTDPQTLRHFGEAANELRGPKGMYLSTPGATPQ